MADKIFIIALSTVAFILINVLVLAYVAYKKTFYNNPKRHPVDPYRVVKDGSVFTREQIDNILKIPHEDIYTTSYDGLKLHARLYMEKEGAPFAIQCHGYHSSPMIDFSGGGPLAMRLGFNIIMIDQRAHGESEGNTISFGGNESRDVISWVNYVREHYGADTKIMLQGISMGAATVLLASCRDDLPDNVVCTLADCPFSSAKAIISKVMSDMGISHKIMYPLARLGARIFGGFDPDTASAESAIKNLKIPLVLIHGEADDFVPCDMSRKIEKAAGGKIKLHTFPNAAHGVSYLLDKPRYEKIVTDFCREHMGDLKN